MFAVAMGPIFVHVGHTSRENYTPSLLTTHITKQSGSLVHVSLSTLQQYSFPLYAT